MTVSIGFVEVVWILINGMAFVLTVQAYGDTRAAHAKIVAFNGRAREIVAYGNLRRERWRLLGQTLLLAAIAPDLVLDRELSFFNPYIIIFVGLSLTILRNTIGDRGDRITLLGIIDDEVEKERLVTLERLEQQGIDLAAAVEENTNITRSVGQRADAAVHEATEQRAVLLEQGVEAAEDRLTTIEIKETGEDTNIKVTKMGEGTEGPA